MQVILKAGCFTDMYIAYASKSIVNYVPEQPTGAIEGCPKIKEPQWEHLSF